MRFSRLCAPLLLSSLALAQADLLFTTTMPQLTIDGTGALRRVHPNEIVRLLPTIPHRSEKWATRATLHANAGDENGDGDYWNPSIGGKIDALLSPTWGGGPTNPRDTFFSPSVAIGPAVSGAPGLRPGDVGRFRKLSGLDGQVEYFITAEQIQLSLGIGAAPAFVNVDAIAYEPNIGVMFSLEDDTFASLTSGPPLIQDGDVVLIPPGALTLSSSGTIAAVHPASAVIAYSEAQMDALVANATVSNRLGTCVTTIIDTDALEIDLGLPIAFTVPSMFGTLPVPQVLFAGQSLTGGAILDSQFGGQMAAHAAGPLGMHCFIGPTTGRQLGLLPHHFGILSSVNALMTAQVCTFVTETPTPQVPVGSAPKIEWHSPPGMFQMMLMSFVPSGPGAVPVSAASPWSGNCYPDYYLGGGGPHVLSSWFATGTNGTYTAPPIPFPGDLRFQVLTFTGSGSGIELSTPTIIEVF
ncbi:MAG: hypothetical protein VYE77_11380 [Planctomycetota bacterium]|nr:hypothetical protein [Planctomycetota bacterium]